MESIRTVEPPLTIPFCVFNGGRDAWLDVGNKKVGVEALQAYLGLDNHQCLHVGDQFLNTLHLDHLPQGDTENIGAYFKVHGYHNGECSD
jgi:hypothetical protein